MPYLQAEEGYVRVADCEGYTEAEKAEAWQALQMFLTDNLAMLRRMLGGLEDALAVNEVDMGKRTC